MENFVLYDEIGSGEKRTVYKGRRKGSVQYVAIHCVEKAKRSSIQNNVRISYELDHRNVVRFFEWYETTNHLWLVVELCTGDSLHAILQQDLFLPETTVRTFGKDLVCGLAYLHSIGIIYADLSPGKLLLDSDGTLKFSNFCLARFENVEKSIDVDDDGFALKVANEGIVGSPMYMAPEVIRGGIRSKQSDLWALGCILYEMYTGSPPFIAETFEVLCDKICEAKTPYPLQGHNGTFKKASENLYMLIQGLLQKEPSQRVDWLELCLHPFWDNELSEIADMLDVRTSRSIMTADSSCTQFTTSPNTQQGVEMHDSIDNIQQEKTRPETVPRLNDNRKLQTQSLNTPEEKDALISSFQSTDEQKEGWKGTYKLERGLAIMDLTETDSGQEKILEFEEEFTNSQYSKSRELKTPRISQSINNITEISLECSLNSVTSLGFSEIIPHLGGPDLNVLDHLYHPSDLIVSPIAENRNLMKLLTLKWDNNLLGFNIIQCEKLRQSNKEEIRKYLETIVEIYSSQLRKNSTITTTTATDKNIQRQKLHILAYLMTAVKVEEMANNILRDDYMKPFLTDLKSSNQQDLKNRVGRLLSVIASTATYIDPSFNMSEIFSLTTDQLKQNFRSPQIKHTFLPVVGEFLFYAATQEENEDRILQNWEPPGAAFTIIVKCLQQQGDDYVSRLMAAKIIENIVSTTGRYCKKFITNEVGLGLWNLCTHAASDIEKVTAASSLCRIGMHSPVIIQHVSDRAGFNSFQVGAYTGTQRTQQSFVTMFVNLLSSPTHAKRILQDQNLITKLIQNLESPSLILKGKMYLLLAEMCARSHVVLLSCCELRMITFIERDSRKVISGKDRKEALEYVHQCLTVVVNNVVKTLPRILEGIIHILEAVCGRHHPNPAQTKQLKIHLPLTSIFLHMITSSMFRKRIADANFIVFAGTLLKLVHKISVGEINLSGQATRSLGENMTTNIFSIIEAITQHSPLLMENQNVFINEVLPVLASFIKSEDGNLRMLCLKLFTDISTIFLESESDELTARKDRSKSSLLKVVEIHFIPEFENLLQDQDPLPAYSLKLLHACSEKSRDLLKILLNRGIMPTLLNILQTHQGDINGSVLQSTIGIFNNIVSEKEIDFVGIANDGFFDNLSSVFLDVALAIGDDTNNSVVSHLLLQLLDTLNHVLKNIEAAVKKVLSNKQQLPNTATSKQAVEKLLHHGKVLAELNGILFNLLVYDDTDIQEWACRCLYLSAELFGAENEDCFTKENLEYICIAIKTSLKKRQKLLLRIVKRYITGCTKFKEMITLPSMRFEDILRELSAIEATDNDSKSVKNVSTELLSLFKG